MLTKLPRRRPMLRSASSTSGAGARADRHPVRSGQRADRRNRNENPVAGRGTRAGRAAITCHNRGATKHRRLSTIHAELPIYQVSLSRLGTEGRGFESRQPDTEDLVTSARKGREPYAQRARRPGRGG